MRGPGGVLYEYLMKIVNFFRWCSVSWYLRIKLRYAAVVSVSEVGSEEEIRKLETE